MDLESAALREAYAVAPVDSIVLDTLEVAQTGETSIYLTNNLYPFTANIEDGSPKTFQAIPFKLALPSKGSNELPTMSIVIANPSQIVSDYLRLAKDNRRVVTVKFRPFLSDGTLTAPVYQLPTPMTFHIGPVKFGISQVEVQCVFPNIANKAFPNENYTTRLFPGLRGW